MILSDTEPVTEKWAAAGSDFQFNLQVRVECLTTLWKAAAHHCGYGDAVAFEEIVDLIGPMEDPSVEDCLLALALPARIPGCTMLNVAIDTREGGRSSAARWR